MGLRFYCVLYSECPLSEVLYTVYTQYIGCRGLGKTSSEVYIGGLLSLAFFVLKLKKFHSVFLFHFHIAVVVTVQPDATLL